MFNRERLIVPALRSLIRQCDEADLDIIVVDDGSTDGTANVVRAMMGAAPIRLIQQANLGVTRARNTGLRALLPNTAFVSFTDSDDVSPPGRFKTDLARFEADPEIEFTYSYLRMVDQIDDETLEPTPGCDDAIFRGVHLAAGIFRRGLIERIGFFDEELAQSEDIDFIYRIFEQRARYAFPDTVAVYYRRHADSLTRDVQNARREFLKAMQKAMRRKKHDPSLGSIAGLIDVIKPYKVRPA